MEAAMARKSQRSQVDLSDRLKDKLIKLSQARSAPLREAQRATMLLKYAEGADISAIAKQMHTTRSTVYKCIDKALSMGADAALKNKSGFTAQSCNKQRSQ